MVPRNSKKMLASPGLTRWGGLFVPPESRGGMISRQAVSPGRVNTVKDVRPLVTRGLILLDRWRVLPRVRVTRSTIGISDPGFHIIYYI